jgi:DNA-directed RNA polymerase subunit beta'
VLLGAHVSPAQRDFVHTQELDKKNINTLFSTMATNHSTEYKDHVSDLTRLGFETATRLGSTVTLQDLLPPIDKKKRFEELDAKIKEVKDSKLSPGKETEKINGLYAQFAEDINKEIVDVGVKNNQTLAKVVKAGARGTATQYRQTVFAPVIVNDAKGKVLTDFPIRRSFAEGLSLPEYLAHTYGSRQGSVATKLAVADAGYLSKQLARGTMHVKVEEHDCGTLHGVDFPVEDKDSIGCFLATSVGGFNRNNEVTNHMLQSLKEQGVAKVTVRSVLTCESAQTKHTGAVCQMCAGRRENGLPAIGSYIGLTASTSLGEPLAQATLNTKHESGSAKKKVKATGFQAINQMFNIPETFKDKAPLSEHTGVVHSIREASQGGHYIEVKADHDGSIAEYYIPTDTDLKVKLGQHLDAGDVLSDGVINPADVVRLKGIGEGRRYFAQALKDTFDASGMGGINRRNYEAISRGVLDHVVITNNDGVGNYLPGSVVSYHAVTQGYQPRPTSKKVRVDFALGKYLEEPLLHYTIGTRLNKTMISHLQSHGIQMVTVADTPPGFSPQMQRLLDVPAHHQDWMHQLYSTNLERRLLDEVNQGATSDLKGASPIPGLAYGVGFGKD